MPPDFRDPAEDLVGPDEFAESILQARERASWDADNRGHISDYGVRGLIRIAYFASQLANEGRFPQLTMLVPAEKEKPILVNAFPARLDVSLLRRLGPAMSSPDHAIVVSERPDGLHITGIVAIGEALADLAFGDPVFSPTERCRGLIVEIIGPGDIRAGETYRHRLSGGRQHQEMSYVPAEWFEEWSDSAASALFREPYHPRIGLIVGALWQYLVRKVVGLRHGGCLVILDDPHEAPIRHVFPTPDFDLGGSFVLVRRATQGSERHNQAHQNVRPEIAEDEVRNRLLARRELLSAVECVAHLSATDGCVVFDRSLKVHSFGSMIEPGATTGQPEVPCFRGDTDERVTEAVLRTFGSRRRSAIRLCQSCPRAMAFVISQDGDLRAVVRQGDVVRLYENLPTW